MFRSALRNFVLEVVYWLFGGVRGLHWYLYQDRRLGTSTLTYLGFRSFESGRGRNLFRSELFRTC